jgi:glycosyltransferase involved in cell wall biosynthesis
VASLVDHTVHLYADHVLTHLTRTAPLPGAISIVLYYPRGHYSVDYGTRLPLNDRAIALAKEWAIRRWRKRSDAHCVLTLDEGAARRWAKMRGAPAHWLPEPPVLAIPSEERQVERNGCILYGSLHPRKGIDLVAQAVTRERTPIRLVLAGAVVDGYGTDLELQVNAMRAAGVTVDFRPFRHSELEGLRALASARCALLPYPRHAGMSRVLLEACSVGTPVVTDNFGLLGHLVREHRLGLAVDTADPLALRGAVLSLTADDRSGSYSEPLAEFAARFTSGRFRSALQSALGLQDPKRAAQGSTA